MACEDIRSRGEIPASPPNPTEVESFLDKEMSLEDLRVELEWAKPNGIAVLPNSKETRITSNTYVFLNVYVVHRLYGILPLEPNGGGLGANAQDPQVKLTSNPDWCVKCNRDLLSYSPKTCAFSYCRVTKKVLGKFRIICSSNSHFVDKQLITITAHLKYRNWVLEKSIPNIRINSKKPRDENDPAYRKRRKRKSSIEQATAQPSAPFPSVPGGIVLESLQPNAGPSNGNTLVTIRGSGFSADSDIIFGNSRLRPFLQNGATDTLLCFSTSGLPGSSVQVFVKEGDRVSEPLYFHYTVPKMDSESNADKIGLRGDAVQVQQFRELSAKYSQLEQLVGNVLNQYQVSGGGSGFQQVSEAQSMFVMMLKSILLDIMQAKQSLKDLEGSIDGQPNWEQYGRVNVMYDSFRGDLNKYQGLDFSNPTNRDAAALAMQRSYESFAAQPRGDANFTELYKGLPRFGFTKMPVVEDASDPFRLERRLVSSSPLQSPPISPPTDLSFPQLLPKGAGLDKLVQAIETLETTI